MHTIKLVIKQPKKKLQGELEKFQTESKQNMPY